MSQSMTFQAYLYGPDRGPLRITLERLAEAMQTVPRLYFEWDGSFTWAGRVPEKLETASKETQYNGATEQNGATDLDRGRRGVWQLSGTLYDNGKSIQYVDLHGRGERPAGREALRRHLGQLFELLTDQPPLVEPEQASASAPNRGGESLARFREQLQVMRLPEQQWQDLRDFEKEFWPSAR